ncbi:N-acetylmuramoyl-L-alanine amidase [Zhouia sp. PK063]|uniref:N-acetylmuramoyl-L-alanine amidase n=1 Tax=Zhouia sp. PK063 TaxID=3373602 RepID=UPI0037B50501
MMNTAISQTSKDKFVVVLDAGHGGHDPGNMGNGYIEKDIALKVVKDIGAILEKRKDIKVVYTRKTDKFVDLFVRGKIANEAKADLFVSIHCNSHTSSAHGTETWVLGLNGNKRNMEVAKKENSVIYLENDYEKHYEGFDVNAPESYIGLSILQEEFLDHSILLAKYVQDGFKEKLHREDRGVKQNIFIVLHQTFMPSVLIELGFLTYKPEGRFLNSSSGQNEMATSIAKSILEYKNVIDENVGDDISYETQQEIDATKEKVAENTKKTALKTSNTKSDVIFKVQIAAGSSNISLNSKNFKGLEGVTKTKVDNIYRYFYGNTSNYDEAKLLQQTAKKHGYKNAFIIAYKNGNRTTVAKALKDR